MHQNITFVCGVILLWATDAWHSIFIYEEKRILKVGGMSLTFIGFLGLIVPALGIIFV